MSQVPHCHRVVGNRFWAFSFSAQTIEIHGDFLHLLCLWIDVVLHRFLLVWHRTFGGMDYFSNSTQRYCWPQVGKAQGMVPIIKFISSQHTLVLLMTTWRWTGIGVSLGCCGVTVDAWVVCAWIGNHYLACYIPWTSRTRRRASPAYLGIICV